VGLSSYFIFKQHNSSSSSHDQYLYPSYEAEEASCPNYIPPSLQNIAPALPCKEGHVWKDCSMKKCPKCSENRTKSIECKPCKCETSSEVEKGTIKNTPVISDSGISTCNGYKRTFWRYGTADKKCPFYASNYDKWPSIPPICDYINMECPGAHILFGIGAEHEDPNTDPIQRSFADFIFLEVILAAYPKHRNFVEVGTKQGITSLYLGMVANIRKGSFYSYDREDIRLERIKDLWFDNMQFEVEDVLGEEPSSSVVASISQDNSIVIFDGQTNRQEEFKKYMSYLKPGSILIGHDFGDQLLTSWITPQLKQYKYIEVFELLADSLSTHFRAFKKI
jgi:hypothetical protein